MSALTISILGSIVLTVLVNLLPRLFPGLMERWMRSLQGKAQNPADPNGPQTSPPVRFFFSWKGMVVASIVLTVVLNLLNLL